MNCLDTRLQKQLRFRVANILLCSLAALSLSFAARAGQAADTALGSDAAQTRNPSSAAPGSGNGLTAAQQTEMQARIDLANTIVQNVSEDAASKGANETWRITLLTDLYQLPSASLRSIAEQAISLQDARLLASDAPHPSKNASSATPKSLGDTTDSLVFNPVAPCRFVDTRNGGNPISTTASTFNLANYGSAYGGLNSCGHFGQYTETAYAIAVNVTVVVNGGPAGYLVLRSTGSSATTSFINWSTGGTPASANAGIISLGQISGGAYNAQGFEALTSGGTTAQMIIDLFGYFSVASGLAESFDCQVVAGTTTNLAANQTILIQAPACPSGYTTTAASCLNNNMSDVNLVGSGPSYNGNAFCQWRNTTSNTNDYVTTGAKCCRTAAQ